MRNTFLLKEGLYFLLCGINKTVHQCNLFFPSEYDLKVTTGSSLGAGTDANVFIKIIGTKGVTAEHGLVGLEDPFERGRSGFWSLLFFCDIEYKNINITKDNTMLVIIY